MDLFTKAKLEIRGDEFHLFLSFNPELTEFSAEFEVQDTKKRKRIDRLALDYARKAFPNIQMTTVSIMAGSMLLVSVPMNDKKVEAADFTMSYLFFGSTQAQIGYVDRTKGNLQVVAPSYFDLNPDGTLKLSWQFDPTFIAEMKNRGVRVVPFLSNHWDRELGRAALNNREVLAQQIADTIIKHNLDGVNVDIENVTHLDRDSFTDLVRLLREKLPADKEVSVAVAANPNGWQTGWHGSYDYKKLAEHSDYLMLMAYDESFNGCPVGQAPSIKLFGVILPTPLNNRLEWTYERTLGFTQAFFVVFFYQNSFRTSSVMTPPHKVLRVYESWHPDFML
ncbi:glycosyl hydrolase family 18 protein [Halalkalibacter alkalisediminis]|uniref:Glycosyl hydrolase family 18 protein n=1 Tax=Halalkalibacter alkalisediminis TaxID=935616 RepID=A0ABV6NGI7_9BACI|nr:glycosyl hydrolase family 18 protein [Halalkalibacter alkalisediminis]